MQNPMCRSPNGRKQQSRQGSAPLGLSDPALTCAFTPCLCNIAVPCNDVVTANLGRTRQRYERQWNLTVGPETYCPEIDPPGPCEKQISVTVKGVDLGPMHGNSAETRRGYIGKRQIVTLSAVKSAPPGGVLKNT